MSMKQFTELVKSVAAIEKATKDAAAQGMTIPWVAVEIFLIGLKVTPRGVGVVKSLIAQSPVVQFSEDGRDLVPRPKIIEVS